MWGDDILALRRVARCHGRCEERRHRVINNTEKQCKRITPGSRRDVKPTGSMTKMEDRSDTLFTDDLVRDTSMASATCDENSAGWVVHAAKMTFRQGAPDAAEIGTFAKIPTIQAVNER